MMISTSPMAGPYSITDLIKLGYNKKTKISGIYIWGFENNSKIYPLYVGKAKKIPQRIYEHLCAWRGGAYAVPNWCHLTNMIIPPDIEYFPDDFSKLEGLITLNNQNATNAQLTIDNVTENFRCWWKAFKNYNNAQAKLLEEALAQQLLASGYFLISHKNRTANSQDFANEFFQEWSSLPNNKSM